MATILARVDDLDYRADGTQTEATVSGVLAWAGAEVTLDLSAGNAEALGAFLAPYLAAGTPTARSKRKRGRAGSRGAGVTSVKRSRAERKAIRDWADGAGLSYISPGGSTYYYRELLDKWDAHKDEAGLTYD